MAVERPNMSETGPEITPTEVQVPIKKGISPEVHQRREEYLVQKEGHEIIVRDPKLVDPNTGENQIIRKIPEVAGGNGFTPEEDAILNRIFDAEQRKRLQANASPGRIRELINSWKSNQTEQRVNPEQQPNQTTAMPDGGDEKGGPPGGSRPPEMNDKEWETSPERGKWLVDEIARLRTTMPYQERYAILDKEGRPYLKQLYKDLQKYVDNLCKIRNDRDPWDPEKAYKEIKEAQKNNPEAEDHKPEEGPPPEAKPEQSESQEQSNLNISLGNKEQEASDKKYLESKSVEDHIREIARLTALYTKDDTPFTEKLKIKETLWIYCREAKRKGLLQAADNILSSAYKTIQSGDVPSDQAARYIGDNVSLAVKATRAIYNQRMEDAGTAQLGGIWNVYTEWAGGTLYSALAGQERSKYREAEFRPGQEMKGKSRETYWKPSGWAGYYTVSARTPEQFRVAQETFLHMIRRGSIGKSPEDVFKHLQNFKEAFGAAGSMEVEMQMDSKSKDKLTDDFMNELRLRFEAQSYIFLADYSNETYNPKTYNQAMTTMALHEGPERWVWLARAGEGQVAVINYMFDQGFDEKSAGSSLMEIFYNPIGERGELDNVAQHFVQDQIKQAIIERAMGIRIKDYDPSDVDPASLARFDPSQEADQVRAKCLKANLERIGIHMPDQAFKDLYEGFDNGDAHIKNYENFRKYDEKIQRQLPKSLKDSVELGRIQVKIKELKLDRQTIDQLKHGKEKIDQLTEDEQKIWRNAYENASANFDIAFQMQGATAEKVRRSKGFFRVDRNMHLRSYREKEDKELKKVEGELKSEQARTKTKPKKRAESILRDKISKFSLKEKREQWNDSQWLGWILSELRDRKRLDTFSQEEQYFYYGLGTFDKDGKFKVKDQAAKDQIQIFKNQCRDCGLGTIDQNGNLDFKDGITAKRAQILMKDWIKPDDREDLVEQMPVHLAEESVQYVVTRTKIAYSDESGIWAELGFYKNGGIEVTKEDGRVEKLTSKAEYRSYMVAQASKDAVKEIWKNGLEAKFTLRKLKFDIDSDFPDFGDVIGFNGQETEVIGLKAAATSVLARYTTHTYWAYQPENRHMLLVPHIFEAAKRIRAGLTRPEDEDMLASLLLILDPTLKRVAKLDNDQDSEEIAIMNAAVEESYQDRQQIVRDLFTAFLPKSGHRGKMRVGYSWEDLGSIRFAMGARELAASQPARFARRLGAGIAFIPIEIDSMPAIWGQRGVSGAINMFADRVKLVSHQGVVSQFGITKFIEQMKYGTTISEALFGRINPETGKEEEGLYKKPTNDAEMLQKLEKMMSQIGTSREVEVDLLHAMIKSLGRLDYVLKLIGAEASLVRNAQGVLWLKNQEIFLEDGRINPEIDFNNDTGTARHAEKLFYDHFMDWLLSEESGGGAETYPGEHWWYQLLTKPTLLDPEGKMTRREWLFNKLYSG